MTTDGQQDVDALRLAAPLRGPVWALANAVLHNGTVVVAAGDSNGTVTWWDGVSGVLLGESRTADPVVVRSMTTVTLPDGQVWFATAGSRGTVQMWDGASGVAVGKVISSTAGPVWSMAALTLPGPRTVLFTGEDDGRIRRWDVETGEPVGEPFGDYVGAVRAMTAGEPIDGRPTLVAGADNGIVCRWDAETGQQLGPRLRTEGGAVWALTIARMPSGTPIVVSAGNNGVLSRWDDTGARLGAPIVVGPGSLSGVVPVTLRDGKVMLICCGTDGRLSCWDAGTGEPIGRPELVSDRGVFSLCTVPDVDGRVRLAFGTDGNVTIAPVAWDLQPRMSAPAQTDSTRVRDGIGRRVLAAHLAALLGELAADSESTSAVVHIDGPWGAGKSTLIRLLLDDEQAHGPAWTSPLVVEYDAWRESAIAPEWWSLVTAIEKQVRRSRPKAVRAVMHLWSVATRTMRSPATWITVLVVLACIAVSTQFPSSWVQPVINIVTAFGVVIGIIPVAVRTLFWHSAPFGRLHLHTEDNPLGQVADMVSRLRGWTPPTPPGQTGQGRRQPILLVIDDLDRCPAERVVKILETVHTILRQPPARSRLQPARLFVIVLADGRWIRHAFTSQFAEFQNPDSATRDIGSDFAQKVFDHVILVPDLSAPQIWTYLDSVVTARTDDTTDPSGVSPHRTADDNIGPQQRPTSPVTTSPDAALSVYDQESTQIDRARQDATAAATSMRSDHLLHTYARLMPANPRMIKRIANTLGMLLAIRIHLRHTEDDDAMARTAILLVRFPLLAARLRLDDLPNSTDPCWNLPDVRNVLGGHSLQSLARCLGRANPPQHEPTPDHHRLTTSRATPRPAKNTP